MGDLTGNFTGEPKASGSGFHPATNRRFTWGSVKRGIHFYSRELACVKFKPVRFWQTGRIKHTPPVFKAPRARANAYFLLVEQIQIESEGYSVLPIEKDVRQGEENCAKNLTGRIS